MFPLNLQHSDPSVVRQAFSALPSAFKIDHARRGRLSMAYAKPLDRVTVLGENSPQGHTGCVNALAWTHDGEYLLSGGDDTTVRIWKLDPTNSTKEYPFTSGCVIQTGHTANIFSAQMLPHSWRIATAAGDNEARVFDVRSALSIGSSPDREVALSSRQSCLRVIRCHTDRVKRVVTEESSDIFLTVSEDGTVRQHDLRTPHTCRRSSSCPDPLAELDQEICTLSLSPLTPYQFVVAGDGPYAFLFDRRHSRRALEASWGGVTRKGEYLTTCVRKFGLVAKPPALDPFRREHITSVRMTPSNGHEVLVSYSGDAVYLFSTTDEPEVPDSMAHSDGLFHEKMGSKRDRKLESDLEINEEMRLSIDTDDDASQSQADTDEENDHEDEESSQRSHYLPGVPLIKPRKRYAGARNVATTKDVNFLGPEAEWVVSGSDDGNFFIWHKKSARLHGIYEGDSSVVNMVEGHPTLPLIAVSGIDYSVKLFAPACQPSAFSRTEDAENIIRTNQTQRRTRVVSLRSLASLLGDGGVQIAPGVDTDNIRVGVPPECTNQ